MTKIPKSAKMILELANLGITPIVYVGAAAMVLALIRYIFAWKNNNSEVQVNAISYLVGAGMAVSIRVILIFIVKDTSLQGIFG